MNAVNRFVIGCFALLPIGFAAVALSPLVSPLVQAADKKVRTSVTGAGSSKSEAENEAAKAARQISFIYTTVSKKTSGSDKTYICTMVIEYSPK